MTRATGTAVLIASLVLAGCGGGDSSSSPTDYSGIFVGRWEGLSSFTFGGQSSSSQTYIPITSAGTNSVVLREFCGDGTGPRAEILSSSSLHIQGLTCPAQAIGTCAAVTFVVNPGGTGNLANGQLAIRFSGSATGCGQTFSYTSTFDGQRTSTNPQALTAELGTVGAALESELARSF